MKPQTASPLARRSFLRQATAGAFAFSVAGLTRWLTPREARAAGAEFRVLQPAEVRALEAIGEALLPGARKAGIANFVDHQLAAPPEACLLMLRYFEVPPPYAAFYRPVLAALDGAAHAVHAKPFAELTAAEAESLVDTLRTGNPPGWQGPPAPLAYLVLRADAVDVVYGTYEGFERLGVPYMPHIMPTSRW